MDDDIHPALGIFVACLMAIIIITFAVLVIHDISTDKAVVNSYSLFSQVKTGSEIKSIDTAVANSNLNCEYNEIISGTNSVVKELIVGPLKLYLWFENGILTKMENKIE